MHPVPCISNKSNKGGKHGLWLIENKEGMSDSKALGQQVEMAVGNKFSSSQERCQFVEV